MLIRGAARSGSRLTALGGALALLVASACSEDVRCVQQPCAASEQAGEAGANDSAASDAGGAGASGSAPGDGGVGLGGQPQAAFAGEPAVGGRFADDASGGSPGEQCRQLYLPLLASRDFWLSKDADYCHDRAPYAAGRCAGLSWEEDNVTIRWEPTLPDPLCLEPGAGSVRFQARGADDDQVVNFSVAPGFETGPLQLTSTWTTYELDVRGLPYDRFDSFGSVPPGITVLSVTPVDASLVYVDDVRWVRASEASP